MLDHLHGKLSERQSSGSMEGWGKTYDTLVGLMTLGQEKKLRQATLALAQIQPGESILEVGCGTGTVSIAAKRIGGPNSLVSGVDIAPDMIESARRKAARAGLEIQFKVGRIESIPFPDGQFDLVLSSLMLHHVHGDAAKQDGLKEIFRVLKPGGRLLIVDVEPPKNPHLKGIFSHVLGNEMLAHSVREFIPLLENARFSEIQTGPTQNRMLSFLTGKRL